MRAPESKLAGAPGGDAAGIGDPDERSNAEKPELRRWLFNVRPWWQALTDMKSCIAVGDIIQRAAATAVDLPGYVVICFVCQEPFGRLFGPAPVLTAEPLDSDATGAISLVCECCWTGKWDAALKDAVHRQFGVPPGELQLLHNTEGNA
jgi:hypothetical protein